MGAKTTDMGVSNMSKSVGMTEPIVRKILSWRYMEIYLSMRLKI